MSQIAAPFDRNAMANWYAKRHLGTDEAIKKVVYLPEGAAPDEIRFVEVNDLISETTPLEPIDFGVDIGGTGAHKLVVLDVTPSQWEAVRTGGVALPDGWTLKNAVVYQGGTP